MKQLTLETGEARPVAQRVIDSPLNLIESTFQGKLKEPVHRWYRMTYSYSPVLVRGLFKQLKVEPGVSRVLDPFAGTGTTLIEARRAGVQSLGIEINPFFGLVARSCLTWSEDPIYVRSSFDHFLRAVSALRTELRGMTRAKVEQQGIEIPKIHNVDRWWRWDVLRDLLAARRVLDEYQADSGLRRLIWVGLASILYDAANTKWLHPTPTFVDRTNEKIDVMELLTSKLGQISHDLELMRREGWPTTADAEVVIGDSTHLDRGFAGSFTHVVTSPPYPNRISYVWWTRPHLYFFRLIADPSEATHLDILAPGGTWGKATSDLASHDYQPRSRIAHNRLLPICEEIRSRSGPSSRILANYVMKYFDLMTSHLSGLVHLLDTGARIAYVVGDSRINGVPVHTESILEDILADIGYADPTIVRFRKRIGRRDIFESVLTASAPR